MKINIKKGMASLYLTAFTTLLLGIVSISFVEVMVNESREVSNSDLSQSALDSALAGVEDAKNAIILYNDCLARADTYIATNGRTCNEIKEAMHNGMNRDSCDTISEVTDPNTLQNGAIEISEGDDNSLEQAYTCVTIANDSPDYRSVLSSDTRSRVVPVNSKKDGKNADSQILAVELQWYSSAAYDDYLASGYMQDYYTNLFDDGIIPLGNKDLTSGVTGDTNTVPIIAFELFQTDAEFTMAELDTNNETNTGTDHAMIVLYPEDSTSSSDKGTFVTAQDLLNASSKSQNQPANVSTSVSPKLVSCGYDTGSRCRTTIQLPATYRNSTTAYSAGTRSDSTFLLRVSLPYGGPQTDFSIRLCTKLNGNQCSEYASFNGVQYIVDSTGRANSLYRRITARIETNTSSFYPEYAVQTSGENATIEKNFYVTNNCWSSDGQGNFTTCANNGTASTEFPQEQ